MTQADIKYRPIKPSDYHILEDMIRKSWNYDRLGSPKLAKQLSKIYLASCLVNQTFTSVAVFNEVPVGIIMGKNRETHRKPLRYLIRQGIAVARIAISKEGRKIGKTFQKVEEVDEILLKSIGTNFDGELAFFVVDGNQRGSGIGKQLYQQFLDYMTSENLKTFYLFTDTTCNFGFYEHQGLERLAEETLDLPELQENMHFYLYGKM
ncbi:GNAT family N-acetyltransferase [Listeria monocytogenes]|jgi:GNAT superfamily N-acetyltransferase|nr:GNAT family N-acetyltransferase [Listeria monocytogenes]